MYKFADVTYPLLVATQADYSLFYATGVVTFRFKLIDPKSRVISADLFRFTALYKNRDRVYPRSVLKVNATYRQQSRAVALDYFKLGLGSTWRDTPSLYDRAKMACSVRLVDRVSPSEYLKVKGERQREDDGVGSVDVFEFRLITRQLHHTVAVDLFFIKNPHSRSFLLGDTSPENTALGGQGYV